MLKKKFQHPSTRGKCKLLSKHDIRKVPMFKYWAGGFDSTFDLFHSQFFLCFLFKQDDNCLTAIILSRHLVLLM